MTLVNFACLPVYYSGKSLLPTGSSTRLDAALDEGFLGRCHKLWNEEGRICSSRTWSDKGYATAEVKGDRSKLADNNTYSEEMC